MSIDAYADIPDLYVHGLPPALLVAQPRPLESIDVGTGTFRLGGAGLADDDPLQFISMGGLVPAGLSASAVYYAIPVPDSESLFQVANTRQTRRERRQSSCDEWMVGTKRFLLNGERSSVDWNGFTIEPLSRQRLAKRR